MGNTKERGVPFEAELNSADASSGVAVPIYLSGSDTSTAYTLASNEYLEVTWAKLVTAAGGDSHIFIGADATLGTNEVIVRGTFAANGGFAGEISPPKVGVKGGTIWVIAPAGAVDVKIQGFIRRRDTSTRPVWKEANRGQ